jgi:hypothetical protein
MDSSRKVCVSHGSSKQPSSIYYRPRIGPFMIVAHLDGYGESMPVALRATRPNRSVAALRVAGFEHVGPYLLLTIESLELPEEGPYGFEVTFDGVTVAKTLQLGVARASDAPPDSVH